MKLIHAIIAITIATLCTVTFSFAHDEDEGTETRHIKMLFVNGGEPIEIDGSDLEVGEQRQFVTEEGQEVVITRTEDGYTVTLDGEDIEIGGGHPLPDLPHGEHGVHRRIFIEQLGDGEGHEVRMIGANGETDIVVDKEFTWHSDGGHSHEGGPRVMVKSLGKFKSPAQQLEESGVLDKVDAATREEILKVLRDAMPHHRGGAHHIFIEKKDGADEDAEVNGAQ